MAAGRPKKPEVIEQHLGIILDASPEELTRMKKGIAGVLPDVSDQVLSGLTKVAFDFMINLVVQTCGKQINRKTQGRRAAMALQCLLIDCAVIHQKLTGEHPLDSLRKLSSGRSGGPEDDGTLYRHPIIRYAGAILVALNFEHDSGWRRQLRKAADRYTARHPEY